MWADWIPCLALKGTIKSIDSVGLPCSALPNSATVSYHVCGYSACIAQTATFLLPKCHFPSAKRLFNSHSILCTDNGLLCSVFAC